LPSLAEYLTVEQDTIRVERWSRQQENRWVLEEFSNLGEIVPLPSIGCELPLARVYRKIELATE
jgi:Uma2 family endonuclease